MRKNPPSSRRGAGPRGSCRVPSRDRLVSGAGAVRPGGPQVSDLHTIIRAQPIRRQPGDGPPRRALARLVPRLRRYHDPAKWLIRHPRPARRPGRARRTPRCGRTPPPTWSRTSSGCEPTWGSRGGAVRGSWAQRWALAYAEAASGTVTSMGWRGCSPAGRSEIDHFYHGGVETSSPNLRPTAAVVPSPARRDWPRQLLS